MKPRSAWVGLLLPLILNLLLGTFLSAHADWPMLAHDPARTGASPDQLRPPLTRKWYRLFPDEGIQSGVQPVIAKSSVFIGTLAGALHAIDAEDGKDLWRFQAGGPILHAAAVHEGMVYFGCADSFVYAVNATDGTACWKFKTGSALWNAPVVIKGVGVASSPLAASALVLIGSRDGNLYALDPITGAQKWAASTGAPLLNSPAVDYGRNCVYIGSESMRVFAFSLSDGRELWRSEQLPGWSMRGYHPVIAPDGAVMVTTAPMVGYDRFQELLLQMVKEIFGDFASWRHKKDENERLRAENFKLMENPDTYRRQLEFFRRRLTAEPAFQTFHVLDPETGRQRFVVPIVASESMNGPGAPPLVSGTGKVIVKYQALLRSRYEHYSPFLNVGYLNTTNGDIAPIMDQTRTYGWHDSLLLVHDEQCQLSLSGKILLNTHQDNVNALDLETLRGFADPWAVNLHEPAKGEALAIRMAAQRKDNLTPGNEWLIRGTAVYGGGSVLDVPVAIADDSFYYVPTHEINSGCALIAYKTGTGPAVTKRLSPPASLLTTEEWATVQNLPWDWDTLSTPRLKNLLDALPQPVPGTTAAPLTNEALTTVATIPDSALDRFIWSERRSLRTRDLRARTSDPAFAHLQNELTHAIRELISREWKPLVTPAAKAPEFAYRFFHDPSETLFTLMLARNNLDTELREQVDAFALKLVTGPTSHDPSRGASRGYYGPRGTEAASSPLSVAPSSQMRVVDEIAHDDLARLYPLYLWAETGAGTEFIRTNWARLRSVLDTPANKITDDCGNSRLAGLIAYCRLAKTMDDDAALARALTKTREAMRTRLVYELAHTRGGVIHQVPTGRSVFGRWRRLTPEVAELIRAYALPVERSLIQTYVDYHRPGWWLAWNVEQLMRNEAPVQLPTTPLEIFTARALLLEEPAEKLSQFLDLPWCNADEFYIQKLALALNATP